MPILLLDEYVSHVDRKNLDLLTSELIRNSSQTFITTTSKDNLFLNENFAYIDLENI